MAHYEQDWDDLGQNIQDIVDRAINSRDFEKLNQTISQTIERAVDLGSEAVRKAVQSASRGTAKVEMPRYRQAVPPAQPRSELPALYRNTGGSTAVGVLKTVGGGVLTLLTLVSSALIASYNLVITGVGLVTFPMLLSLTGLGGSALLLGSGVRSLNRLSRFKAYLRTLGHKTYCTLDKLSRSVGKSEKFVRKELRQMISEGLFLEGHLDHEQKSLITSDETYRHYETSRLQLQQRQQQEAAARLTKAPEPTATADPRIQEVLDRGNAFLAQIRKCNDDIPGEEISSKISRMELIVQRIFARAQAHPEIITDLKKLMDYYLPMTVKLLGAYAEMDAQPIQGQTILSSKREIEASLDTLNLAFEKLLDSVFKETALDVSSDISVLNTLLAQEGLTQDDFKQ